MRNVAANAAYRSMRKIINISRSETVPSQIDTFLLQGNPRHTRPPQNIVSLFEKAEKIFMECAEPAGIVADISKSEFIKVYKGESRNEKRSPVAEISERADYLALFAVTIGQATQDKISELFENGELTLGIMLDAVASAAAEMAADEVERKYLEQLRVGNQVANSTAVLRYSPGYCGWHVSGQKKLFEFLRPSEIGITLLESFLMTPLKSISGVLLTGKKEIHIIEADYAFCSQCKTHSCQQRIGAFYE
jgi:hypothetical protein